LERRKIILDKILLGDVRIVLVSQIAIPVFDVIPSIMLAGSYDTLVRVCGIALETLDQSFDIRRKMVSIFSGSFLPTSPARISKGVDVRRLRSLVLVFVCIETYER
jgi:hypothetical protein